MILVDGRDIRTLKLSDLRDTIATMFQDFQLFPLSIKDNILMGDVRHTKDDALVESVAKESAST